MGRARVWLQIPYPLRSDITALGETLGTGSVKQVLRAKLKSTDRSALAAVVRDGVVEEINTTVGALRVLDDTKHMVDRIEPMLAREVDLELEAKAFDALRETPTGKSPIVAVPEVFKASKTALLREDVPGEPISAILRKRPLDGFEQERLTEVHRLLLRTALDTEPHWLGSWVHRASGRGTFVLTDPHQGNVADDGNKVGLFDPGQYENLTKEEAELFVRMLVAFSKRNWQRRKRPALVDQLSALCSLSDPNAGPPSVRERLDQAYEEIFRENDATVGRKLHLLLLEASKNGVAIPNGYFGLAKMLHSLASQEQELLLPDVVGSVIRQLYLAQLGVVGRLV
jgi:predicted unusual protein kinase regulating ubiquinone biosynthesis (AarF/ABC1/UbiB family)